MAEQDLISFGDVTDASSRSPLARKGLSSADVNGNEESRTSNSQSEENRSKLCAPTPNGGPVVMNGNGEHESLMDSLDDEQPPKNDAAEALVEGENRECHHQAPNEVNDEHQQHASAEQNTSLVNLSYDEATEGPVVAETTSSVEHAEFTEEEIHAVKEHLHEITTTSETTSASPQPPTEMPSVNGHVQQDVVSKPQVIGETYRSVQSASTPGPKQQQTPPATFTNGHHVNLKNTGSYNANNAESLIAMEIRELREREEELKKMRERLMAKPVNSPHPAPNNSAIDTSATSLSPDSSLASKLNGGGNLDSLETTSSGRNTPLSPDETTSVTRAISLDSLQPAGQNYNLGYAFGHRRKDNIKVKPLADQESDDEEKKRPLFKVFNESPIEREIRLAQEREEALRREKAAVLGEAAVTPKDRSQKVDSTPAQRPSTLHPSIVAKPKLGANAKLSSGDTQKVIATVRIQQEIEEQTQRELALKAAGSIQTISHERIDSKISTKLVESSSVTNGVHSATPAAKSPVSAASYSLPDVEICEKTSAGAVTSNGSACHHKSTNGSVLSPGSSSSNSSGTGVPVVANRRFVPNATGAGGGHRPAGISMQKFISSKGKDFVFSTFSKSTGTNGVNGTVTSPTTDYYEIKPPQVRKTPDGSIQSLRKGLIPAESKIQEELKEMKAREDELKRQRARSLNPAVSQPNLTTDSDEKEMENGKSPEVFRSVSVSDAIDSLRDRCSSNPNLSAGYEGERLENGNAANGDSEKGNRVGGPRRRSTLIAQWEQMIQGTETTGLRT